LALPTWLTIAQAAEYCGVDRAEVYYKMLRNLEVRRIGVRGGVMPYGRLIRVERPAAAVPIAVGAMRLGRDTNASQNTASPYRRHRDNTERATETGDTVLAHILPTLDHESR
jgi:hypothetical protein